MTMFPVAVTLLVLIGQSSLISAQETPTNSTDHMCEKIIRESVPEVYRDTISVTVKGTKKCGFLWLQTCTKYSVDIRTVTRMRYTMKEYTKLVCCNGTDVNGGCVTPPPVCNKVGMFGPNCDQICECNVTRTSPEICDQETGYCYCLEGYDGPRCNKDINSTVDYDYDAFINGTDWGIKEEAEIAGGGDIVTRAVIAVIVVFLILTIAFIVFLCWRHKLSHKGVSSGSTVSDDFVVSLNPTQNNVHIDRVQATQDNIVQESEDSNCYVTPEQVRKRKRDEAAANAETTPKTYDYVEMRNVSESQCQLPTSSGSVKSPLSSSPSLNSSFTASLSRKVLEREAELGRQSLAYANIPSPNSSMVGADNSQYYLGDSDRLSPQVPVSPTYSLMRRQESGDSAFDDDGYCTSPTTDDGNTQYSVPRYIREKRLSEQDEDCSTENIYDCLTEKTSPIPVPVRHKDDSNPPEYANISESISPTSTYDHIPFRPPYAVDGYDHIQVKNSSTA